jgi:hypothetical protein
MNPVPACFAVSSTERPHLWVPASRLGPPHPRSHVHTQAQTQRRSGAQETPPSTQQGLGSLHAVVWQAGQTHLSVLGFEPWQQIVPLHSHVTKTHHHYLFSHSLTATCFHHHQPVRPSAEARTCVAARSRVKQHIPVTVVPSTSLRHTRQACFPAGLHRHPDRQEHTPHQGLLKSQDKGFNTCRRKWQRALQLAAVASKPGVNRLHHLPQTDAPSPRRLCHTGGNDTVPRQYSSPVLCRVTAVKKRVAVVKEESDCCHRQSCQPNKALLPFGLPHRHS